MKFLLSISVIDHDSTNNTSQIFDVNHLQETLRNAHLCPGGRLEFIIDQQDSCGLFHKNGLQCSICNTITDLTNFRSQPAFKIQAPNHRLYAASAVSGIGYDSTNFILSMLGVRTPHRSNFYKQIHVL